MLWASENGQGFGVRVEFLGRHLDPSFSEGDLQVRPKIGFIPARPDIDSPHGFFDEGLTLRPLVPYVLLTKSLPSGARTCTPRLPLTVGDRRCRRHRTSGMALALAQERCCVARPEDVGAASPLVATLFMVTGLTARCDISKVGPYPHQHKPMSRS